MKDVIALCGLAGAGKSTVADYLIAEHGYTRVKFADGLKNMLRAIGLDEDEIEGGLKERPCSLLCGKTPRHAMITLGTEWGRKLIGPDFWTTIWRERAAAVLNSGGRVVVDDVRFPNEAQVAADIGAYRVLVMRAPPFAGPEAMAHESELHALQLPVDAEILNDGSVDDLIAQAALRLFGLYGEPA